MSVAKKEINYGFLEKNLTGYEPIKDERIKNFIIENKNILPFLKEAYPIIKEFFPKDKLILEYVDDEEYPDWIRIHIIIKIKDKEEFTMDEFVDKEWEMCENIMRLKKKYNVATLVNSHLSF